jgi:hypothetical protein
MNNRVFTNLHKVAGNDDSKKEKTTMTANTITQKSGAEALRYQ